MGFSQTRNPLKVSQPRGLKNDLLCSRPLWACSHLENRELSHFCIAHCVRWVARLYQKTSLVPYRWVRQASSTGLPEAFTCPVPLNRPGRPGARSLHLSCPTGQARSTGLHIQIARSLHLSNRFRLARTTGLFETLSLESLTRFGTLSLESLTPLIPDLDLLGMTSTDCATDLPTRPTTRKKTPQEIKTTPSDNLKCSRVAVR